MREWLIAIGIILIVGILIDGVRRMRASRRDTIKIKLRDYELGDADQYGSELPGGGARVVTRDLTQKQQGDSEKNQNKAEQPQTRPSEWREPEQTSLLLDEPVPLLMETADPEPSVAESDPAPEPVVGEDGRVEPTLGSSEPVASRKAEKPATRTGGKQTPTIAEQEPDGEREVLVINVMATDAPFAGAELLDAVLACGLKYGEMNIFHRHTDEQGEGPVLFSMANIVVPGTFDLDAMDQFTSPGVSLFMTLPVAAESLAAFELMQQVALELSKRLGGELRDEKRSTMTSQTLEHCRQRIRDFERRRQLARARL